MIGLSIPKILSALNHRQERLSSGHDRLVTIAADPVDGCAYRKLGPNVMMMQSTQHRHGLDLPMALDSSLKRRVLPQRLMRAQFIVIFCISSQEPAKVCFIDDNAVIDALATDRADQALGVRILPWGSVLCIPKLDPNVMMIQPTQ